jgi:hypothetical protein
MSRSADFVDSIFEVPAMPCPLLKGYLRAALAYIPDNSMLWENERRELIGYTANAVGTHQATAAAQRLRGFYCVEFVFMWLRHLDNFTGLNYAPTAPTARTWQSLDQLRKQIAEYQNMISAHALELRMRGRKTSMTFNQVVKEHIPKIWTASACLVQMIELLRPALGQEAPALGIVGSLLAKSTADVGVTSLFVKHAQNLVNITEGNGISPWELKELQVLSST